MPLSLKIIRVSIFTNPEQLYIFDKKNKKTIYIGYIHTLVKELGPLACPTCSVKLRNSLGNITEFNSLSITNYLFIHNFHKLVPQILLKILPDKSRRQR